MTGERLGEVPFQAHVELLQLFLVHRDAIVESIQGLLNAQRNPSAYLQDGPLLSRHFEDCFFTLTALTPDQSQLRGQLKNAHWASGFKPSAMPGMHNDLVDPGEMMVRGFHLWRQTRWPGRNGRARYAHTLFNSYLLRCLELLSMRLWDAGASRAGARLAQIQGVLDQVWKSSPTDQPVLVRDARWLIPLALSPTTDELAAYFTVAEHIAATPAQEDRLEIYKASVQMAGGHLRSQLRHYILKQGVALDENSLVLSARSSNALDLALTIQGLVPLLQSYEQAWRSGEQQQRLALADTICQGISADPELFVNRVDLLRAYSMIEYLFIATDGDAQTVYTPVGQRHLQLLDEYAALINRVAKRLHEDCVHFRPVDGAYSPYGVIFGFSSNLTEHMALKALQPETTTPFSVEDVFAAGSADKLAWVSGWRKLPHIDPQVQRLFDYPQQFAHDMFERIEHSLRTHVADAGVNPAVRTGRLFILSAEDPEADSQAALIPELPIRYIKSYEESRLLHDRQEGTFLVSYQTSRGWVAITKDVLTEVLGAGCDVKIGGLSRAAVGVLRLMCPNLVMPVPKEPCRSPVR
ncbi:MAG TPA: hypothetical protein VK727_19115 [Steroidobacteraceae bacterium]|nr:hypothetical protein [Steroidobacteraceae bacterium]